MCSNDLSKTGLLELISSFLVQTMGNCGLKTREICIWQQWKRGRTGAYMLPVVNELNKLGFPQPSELSHPRTFAFTKAHCTLHLLTPHWSESQKIFTWRILTSSTIRFTLLPQKFFNTYSQIEAVNTEHHKCEIAPAQQWLLINGHAY